MTVHEMKMIVKCFERWLDTPDARAVIQGVAIGVDEAEATAAPPRVLPHIVRHAVAVPSEMQPETVKSKGMPVQDLISQPGSFASLMSGEYKHTVIDESSKVAPMPTKTSGVGEFLATVSGEWRKVRFLSKSGGVIRVQIVKDGSSKEVSLTILSSIDQVHPDDQERVKHLFGGAA